jgi:hypothetical protein
MTGRRDIPELLLEEDRESAAEPVLGLPRELESDQEELEFDLLGATSQRPQVWDVPPLVGSSAVRVPPHAAVPVIASHGGAPVIPELDVPGPKAVSVRPPPESDPTARGAPRTPLRLELGVPDLERQPRDRRSSNPPPSGLVLETVAPGSVRRADVPPHSKPPSSRSVSPQPHISIPPAGAMGQELVDWDLDESLGLGAAALQVNAAVVAAPEDDGPWPTGNTPAPEEFDFSPEELLALSGFGAAPSQAWLTPLYYFRVQAGRKQLAATLSEKSQARQLEEDGRDDILVALAGELRARLSGETRFASLFDRIGGLEHQIVSARRAIDQADAGGADQLRAIVLRMAKCQEEAQGLAKEEQGRRQACDQGEREFQRKKAMAARLQIEMRNIARIARERAPQSPHMPPDLGARYVEVEAQFQAQTKVAKAAEQELGHLRRSLTNAQDASRRAAAELGRAQAEREAFELSHAGTLAGLLGDLKTAERDLRAEMARAARAILDLRGEVPVDRGVREAIAAKDERVKRAARAEEMVRRAEAGFDITSIQTGQKILIGGGVGLAAGLLWVALG